MMTAKKRAPKPPWPPEPQVGGELKPQIPDPPLPGDDQNPTITLPAPAPGECRALGCGQPGNHPGGYCCDHYRGVSR